MKESLSSTRSHKVVKANELIQKSRFSLSTQEQKIILYLISKIKPEDMEMKEHTFEILDFCKVCGLDKTNGANYKYIKQTLKELRDKSIWIEIAPGTETTLAWIDNVTMRQSSGKVTVKIDDKMKPYLLQLRDNFTEYELYYILAMKSQYSFRLYELLKSYAYQNKPQTFDIEVLKKKLSAETYARFPDFKRKVLDISMRELNELSDIKVSYEIEKDGRKFASLIFTISHKNDMDERLNTWVNIEKKLNPKQITGQISLDAPLDELTLGKDD